MMFTDRLFEKWGNFLQRNRWKMIIFWVLLIAVGGILGGKLASVLTGGGWDVEGSESLQAKTFLAESFPERSATDLTLVVRDPQHEVGSDEYSRNLQLIIDQLLKETSIDAVYSWLDAPEEAKEDMIGEDKNTSMAYVNMNIEEGFAINLLPGLQQKYADTADELGIEAYLLGTSAFWGDVSVYSQKGLVTAELIALPLIFIILLLVFRSLVAAITPMLITVSSVVLTMGIIYLVGLQMELSIFITNAAVMLGLGIGIDYSLIIVNRFRQELAENQGVEKAVIRTMQTAGHTVLFSGITVMAAMSALFIVKLPAIQAMALGAIIVVLVAVLSSLSLLLVVLSLLGERINKGKIKLFSRKDKAPTRRWLQWTYFMMRKPVLFLSISVAVLLMMAIPAADMKLFSPDTRILPSDSLVRQGSDLVEKSYGKGVTTPISLVIHSNQHGMANKGHIQYLQDLHETITSLDEVQYVNSLFSLFAGMESDQIAAIMDSGTDNLPVKIQFLADRFISNPQDVTAMEIVFREHASSEESKALVKSLQEQVIPDTQPPEDLSFYIGGQTSAGLDTIQALEDSMLPALFIMLVLIYSILVVTFRSVILPLKAIVMNLVSVGATYGVLVFVFAKGHGIHFFGAEANGYIIHFVPILLLAILFSLSTDYEVFLLSRVKEEYDDKHDNEKSIALGMEATGPLISGAALLMIAVFSGFAFSGMLPIQMLGFGMAVAIAIDATIIRLIIVPVSMKLLGRWNWWFPGQKTRKADKMHDS